MQARVTEYLRLRRAMGYKLTEAGYLLPKFAAFLDGAGAQAITVEFAVAWAGLPEGVQPIHWAHRLGAVRGFARWLATIDPATEIPPAGVFAARQQRPTPYIYTPAQVAELTRAARQLRPALQAATYEALFGLLGCSGLRLGEAVGLARADVDLTEGIVTVRHPKFDRERLVPLHPSATEALRGYADCRNRLCPAPRCDAFFVSTVGSSLTNSAVQYRFARLSAAIGLRTTTSKPRIHDLRHAVAVNTLIDWYRDDVDVTARLPLLATLLGHVNPTSLYWYLTAMPQLMHLIAAHPPADRPVGDRPDRSGRLGGVSGAGS